MQINKTQKYFYLLVSFILLMLTMLGSWWLVLVFRLADQLKAINSPLSQSRLVNMIQWEGATFLILVILLTGVILYIYFQDNKKTSALQAFFSSLTHELKTPLASMRLQSEVIQDYINELSLSNKEKEKITKYSNRLLHDSMRLENQLDTHLQLSRVERDAILNLNQIDLADFTQSEIKRYQDQLPIKFHGSDNKCLVRVDDFALKTIIRNLIENSLRHAKTQELLVTIELIEATENYSLKFSDNGSSYQGPQAPLGTLFFKHNSPSGSGIGLYLIKKLTTQMKGQFQVSTNPSFEVTLSFPKATA